MLAEQFKAERWVEDEIGRVMGLHVSTRNEAIGLVCIFLQKGRYRDELSEAGARQAAEYVKTLQDRV